MRITLRKPLEAMLLTITLVSASGCGMTIVPLGFVKENRHGVCRGWFDFNTYRRPSFSLERTHRLPPNSARVKFFRYHHGGSVGEIPTATSFAASETLNTDCPPTAEPTLAPIAPIPENFSEAEQTEPDTLSIPEPLPLAPPPTAVEEEPAQELPISEDGIAFVEAPAPAPPIDLEIQPVSLEIEFSEENAGADQIPNWDDNPISLDSSN